MIENIFNSAAQANQEPEPKKKLVSLMIGPIVFILILNTVTSALDNMQFEALVRVIEGAGPSEN
jgi:hypothetical protein